MMHLLTRSSRTLLTALVAAALLGLSACGGGGDAEPAQPAEAPPLPDGELTVENPWVRPAQSGGNSALYLTVANGTASADTLLSAEAPIVGTSSIHTSAEDSAGTVKMEPVGPLPIPAQTRVTLEPGGTHVMLMNLSQPLTQGEAVVLNLEFAKSGLRRIRAPIQNTAPESGS